MTLVLSVDELAWRAHLDLFADGLSDVLIPVVKGNGYGFGRPTLIEESTRLGAPWIAVGTIHEIPQTSRPESPQVIVLTPTFDALVEEADPSVVLTVGSAAHISHLREAGFGGGIIVKLASSMSRYGFTAEEFDGLDIEPVSFSIHPPLAGGDAAHLDEIERWLDRLDPLVPVQVSHLSREGFDRLRSAHPHRQFQLRCGTALWHGDKSMLRLSAAVIDVRSVTAGQRVGYRQVEMAEDGFLVMIGAGSAHGIAPFGDGRSPFHFASRRLALVESPHMHTSMAFVPSGSPVPRMGETVDVQRPLTQTWVDRVVWIR